MEVKRKLCCQVFGGALLLVTGVIGVILIFTVSLPNTPFTNEQESYLNKIREQGELAGLPKSVVNSIPEFDEDVCYEIPCLESALEIMSAANFMAKPCEPTEWLEFACLRRIRDTEAESLWSQLASKVDQRTRALLDEEMPDSKEFLLKEAQTYYKQCLNRGHRDEEDVWELLDWTTKLLGGFPIFTYEIPPPETRLMDMIADQNRFGFTPMFIKLKQSEDIEHFEDFVLQLDVGRITFFNTDPKKETEDYVQLISSLVQVGKLNELADTRQLKECLHLVHNLTKTNGRKKIRRRSDKTLVLGDGDQLETMSLQELQERSDIFFANEPLPLPPLNWTRFFERVYATGGTDIIDRAPLKIRLPFQRVMDIIRLAETAMMRAQDRKCIVNAMHLNVILTLSQETTALMDNLNMIRQQQESGTREDLCLKDTKGIFGYSLTKTYLNKYHPELSTESQHVHQIMSSLRKAFDDYFKSEAFQSQTAKEFFIDKTESIKIEIGMPDWMKEPGALEKYYDGLQISTYPNASYVHNGLEIITWSTAREGVAMLRILSAKDSTEFDSADYSRLVEDSYLPQISPSYDAATNKIFLPAPVLQKPLFGMGGPGFVDYSVLGTTMAHEIAHSCIDGRDTDKFGKKSLEHLQPEDKEWFDNWANNTKWIYENVPYETNERLGPVYVNKTSVNEDLADLVAVRLAFKAYEAHLTHLAKEGKMEKSLPGLKSLTPQQLFFIVVANVDCEDLDPQAQLNFIFSEDPHSLAIRRAHFPVWLSPHFHSTFKCNQTDETDNSM